MSISHIFFLFDQNELQDSVVRTKSTKTNDLYYILCKYRLITHRRLICLNHFHYLTNQHNIK